MSRFLIVLEDLLKYHFARGETAKGANLRLRYILPLDRARTRA